VRRGTVVKYRASSSPQETGPSWASVSSTFTSRGDRPNTGRKSPSWTPKRRRVPERGHGKGDDVISRAVVTPISALGAVVANLCDACNTSGPRVTDTHTFRTRRTDDRPAREGSRRHRDLVAVPLRPQGRGWRPKPRTPSMGWSSSRTRTRRSWPSVSASSCSPLTPNGGVPPVRGLLR
jgi:hypothetical protein